MVFNNDSLVLTPANITVICSINRGNNCRLLVICQLPDVFSELYYTKLYIYRLSIVCQSSVLEVKGSLQ